MNTVDIVGLLVPVTYFVFLVTERLWPAREFPPRKGWHWIGMGFLVMVMTISTVVPLLIPESWLARHRLLDGTGLGVVGGTLVGIVVLEGVVYVWHRSAHNVGFLWRGFHQIHHSPRRVDIAGSLVFHPTEVVVQTLLQLAVTVIVLGLDPLAAALTGYFIAFNSFFQHWNVRTPQWLGYLIQRPEAHCVRPPDGRPLLQLRGPRRLGHAVRDVPQSASVPGRVRLRGGRRPADGRDVRLRRRERAAVRTGNLGAKPGPAAA